jgi:hypothetical protein
VLALADLVCADRERVDDPFAEGRVLVGRHVDAGDDQQCADVQSLWVPSPLALAVETQMVDGLADLKIVYMAYTVPQHGLFLFVSIAIHCLSGS